MDIINLDGTEETPKVLLDKENGMFEMSGRSLPEDAAEFYRPIMTWLDTYSQSPNDKTEFNFKLEYFNTASSKLILDILSKLETIGESVKVHWFYHEDDEDMEEAGTEFEELIDDLEFVFETY